VSVAPVLHVASALVLAPLLLGVISRTKAVFAGRHGPSLFQPYHDIAKLLRKGAVYSRSTTWIFRTGPVVTLAGLGVALLVLPLGAVQALAAFPGDLVLFAYLLGLGRFVTVLAALDTGSAFEGMGASREVQFSALAEPALLLGLGALAVQAHSVCLTGLYGHVQVTALPGPLAALLLVAVSLFIVLLAENCRIPIDDPNTHLELTMIHEVMVLDHGGVDLAFIQYGAALKMWILAGLVTGLILPVHTGHPVGDLALGVAGQFILALAVGIVESTMARLRLLQVPQLLTAALILSLLSLILMLTQPSLSQGAQGSSRTSVGHTWNCPIRSFGLDSSNAPIPLRYFSSCESFRYDRNDSHDMCPTEVLGEPARGPILETLRRYP